jgi:hypothetical protein
LKRLWRRWRDGRAPITALATAERARQITESLLAKNPGNLEWQRDFFKIGAAAIDEKNRGMDLDISLSRFEPMETEL